MSTWKHWIMRTRQLVEGKAALLRERMRAIKQGDSMLAHQDAQRDARQGPPTVMGVSPAIPGLENDTLITFWYGSDGSNEWIALRDNHVVAWVINTTNSDYASPSPRIIEDMPTGVPEGSPAWAYTRTGVDVAVIPKQYRGNVSGMFDHLYATTNRKLNGDFLQSSLLNTWNSWASRNTNKVK